MSLPKTIEYIFYKGSKFQIEFYYNGAGKLPAKEYLEASKSSLDLKLKIAALVKYITEYGKIYDTTKFRIVDRKEKIYEFKPLNHRFFNFFYKGKKIIITNAYMKKSQKLDKKELKKAINMKKDYTNRVKGGTYYEKKKS